MDDSGRLDRENDEWGGDRDDSWGRNKSSRDDDDYRGGGYNSPRSRPGDWNCGECQFSNFASRNSCYKCNASKDGGMSRGGGGGGGGGGGRPGDWECSSCQFSNFAFRDTCFKCNGSKGGGGGGGGRSRYGGGDRGGGGGGGGRHPGDWDCPECQFMNFGSRDECLKCRARRGGGGGYRRRDSSRSPPRGGGGGGSRRPGDWFCSQCQFSNFASRERCFKCAASKDSSF
ncbi:unnamed protein product [Meganyctiphanes norvegica]|uniref:RanBP2-type domain-containing protein n=1 Tax=Meganyctiphanes norvegica TaxID=48144 RepID=A0AAV2SH31_MEGNR